MKNPEKPKKGINKIWLYILLFLIAAFIYRIYFPAFTPEHDINIAKADSLKVIAGKEKENMYTAHFLAKEWIKSNLKDPNSFEEHDYKSRKLIENKDGIAYEVWVDYSAKNGFGGMNRSTHVFDYSKNLLLLKEYKLK